MMAAGDDAADDASSRPYGYLIESVDNSARILLMLKNRPAIRAADIARELGVARSTAHRMVSTLQHRGLLRQNAEDKSYSAGFALVELGLSILGATDLRTAVKPYLDRLAGRTGETTHLLLLEEQEVVFVAGTEGEHVVRAALRVGSRLPAHVTAAGRCLLAALPEEQVVDLYPSPRLRGGTRNAIHGRKELLEDLRRVRAAGYAVNEAESEESLLAVGMPVRDSRGAAQGAISVSGPVDRMRANLENVLADLGASVRDIETRVFHRTTPGEPERQG
jgi:DNA-binding IclR family transcriptional regulator